MSKKILLADDSVTIQKVVELTFLDRDYQVEAVGSGAEALERLAAERPDLVIADVHMPGANGYEVCRRAKDRDPTLPVLLLVGTFEPFDESAAAAAGADAHLKKPFDAQDLLQHAEALLRQSMSFDASEAPTTTMRFDDEPPTVQTLRPTFGGGPVSREVERPSAEVLVDTADVSGSAGRASADTADTADVSASAAAADEAGFDDATFDATLDDEPAPAAGDDREADRGIAFELDQDEESPNLVSPPDDLAVPEAATPPAAAASPTPEPGPEPVAAEPAAGTNGHGSLSDDDVERIARRVAELVGEKVLREVAWDVLPDLAEVAVRERIRELESQVE